MCDQHKSAIVTSKSASPLCQFAHESDSLVPQRHDRSRRKQQPGLAQAYSPTTPALPGGPRESWPGSASLHVVGWTDFTVSETAGIVRREKNLENIKLNRMEFSRRSSRATRIGRLVFKPPDLDPTRSI
jgi:hypothetical protein